jgi:multiple sugar transport system ATP-binding protein
VVVLDQGFVQQAATPAELYDQPSNRFVASFIGWPAMNFLDGRLEGCDFVSGGEKWRLSERQAEKWTPFRDRELTIGIRPERVSLLDSPNGCPFEAVWVEAAGAATVIELERQGTRLTAWTAKGSPPRLRQKVSVVIDMDQAHLFDRITGEALCHPGTG